MEGAFTHALRGSVWEGSAAAGDLDAASAYVFGLTLQDVTSAGRDLSHSLDGLRLES